MNTKDFYYDLPPELIAQTPLLQRDASRLMVLDRKHKSISHRMFGDLLSYLREGDCIVINETKVIPARLYGTKSTGASVEILLLDRLDLHNYKVMVRPAKRLKIGSEIDFGGKIKGTITEELDEGLRVINLKYDGILEEILDSLGEMPLPPYIVEKLKDKDRYQTVYARNSGSSAAPTAGLHFTDNLLSKIKKLNVSIARLTLHVGLGTFRPVKVDDVKSHVMHSEYYELDESNCKIINNSISNGGRIFSVGTTSTRTLETIASKHGCIVADSGNTDIFIYPGYEFKAIDAQITNFHLPESTLMMLVSAFYEKDEILKAYKEAVLEKYRFFSFGDAMLIL